MARRVSVLFLASALAVLASSTNTETARGAGEWHTFAADSASTKYSPLDQINASNFATLRVAWRWRPDTLGARPDYNLQATPIMVNGVLYTTAGSRRSVAAIDAATGETLWTYRLDEGSRGAAAPIRSASGRGVAYWTDGKEERILHVTQGYRLVALDAKTGRTISSFGTNGVVDLFEGLDRRTPPPEGVIGWNSPPTVVRDVVVVGAAFGTSSLQYPTIGHIRGYDVH